MVNPVAVWLFALFFHRSSVGAARFPDGFRFGSASASYQIEGAWNVDGKGESIWDHMVHEQPDRIFEQENGDVAADSYHNYLDDVQMLSSAGMQFYRFSIAWSRVLPNGNASSPNEAGLVYYDNLINALLAKGIEPVATIYHWDLPQSLQVLGGMLNPEIVDHYLRYAEVLFERYGDRVKTWITFNEPLIFCNNGYDAEPVYPPLVPLPGEGHYLCSHHVLLANARAYDLYKAKYGRIDGRIGITINCRFAWPKDLGNATHVAAAERYLQFTCGHYAHPIFSIFGGYPQVMIDQIQARSTHEGRQVSRMPLMTDAEKQLIKGKSDFLGLNYYTSNFAEPAAQSQAQPSLFNDLGVDLSVDPQWPQSKSFWLRSVPAGLRALLNWFRREYNSPEIFITENGWSDNGELNDNGRIEYMKDHLQATLDAIINDGCNVTAYTCWSIMDNFEWTQGYSERFGLYHVDFNTPERTRTAKASVRFLRGVIQRRTVPT